jgi:PilZ domain
MEKRVELRRPIQCRMECSAGTQTFMAEGFDMSESGVSFNTPFELPLDTEVVLRYRLQHDGPMVTARVLIRQQNGGRYGAKFLIRKAALESGG